MARQADTELDMVRGTMYGPMRLTPLLRSVSALVMMFSLEAPPDDAMSPVRGLEMSLSSSPASSIAHFIAM